MQVSHNTSGQVVSSGITDSKTFDVKVGGKLFHLLSDTLYTDKVGSCIRELSCNALDSHKSANKGDVPFAIHIPSIFEPYFYVEDFGVGMSHDDVMNICGKYLESTKDLNNDSIGGFGLGMKTPLAYSDSYTIRSTFDGMVNDYVIMMGADHIPSISHINSEKVSESVSNGLKVQFNVRQNDCYLFERALVEQLRFFTVKPSIINGEVVWNDPIITKSFGDFDVIENESEFWIVQGEVGYPLNMQYLQEHVKDSKVLKFFTAFSGGVLNFPIGEIEVTLSREDVSYSQYTIESLTKFINRTAPIISEEVIKDLEKMDNDWDRLCALNSDVGYRKIFNISGKTLGKDGDFGDKLGTVIAPNTYSSYQLFGYELRDVIRKKTAKCVSYSMNCYHINNDGKKKSIDASVSLTITPKKDTVILIRDKCHSAIGRAKHYAVSNMPYNVYMFQCIGGVQEVTDELIEKISNAMGGVKVVRTSELTPPPKNSLAKNGTPCAYVLESSPRISVSCSHSFSVSTSRRVYDPDELDDCYYVTMETYPYVQVPVDFFNHDREYAKFIDRPIVVVKDSNLKILTDNDDIECTPLDEKIEEIKTEIEKRAFKNMQVAHRYYVAKKIQDMVYGEVSRGFSPNYYRTESIEDIDNAIKLYGKNSVVGRIARIVRLAYNYRERVSQKINDLTNIESKIIREKINLESFDDILSYKCLKNILDSFKFSERYPMLEKMSYWTLKDDVIHDYIKMCDDYSALANE